MIAAILSHAAALLAGIMVGVLLAACCAAARRGDRDHERGGRG